MGAEIFGAETERYHEGALVSSAAIAMASVFCELAKMCWCCDGRLVHGSE
jgi:hypothetical protein